MTSIQNLPPISDLPYVYRIRSLLQEPLPNGCGVRYTIELYHEHIQLNVTFTRSQPDIRLRVNKLVSIRWKLTVLSSHGAIHISRLALIERPLRQFNLFDTVPPSWVSDRKLVTAARDMLDRLPSNLQHLFCAVMWDGFRFRRFCEAPSSLNNHHAYRNGNLKHTIETAENAMTIAKLFPQANLGICLAAALLHDVGKADEYVSCGPDYWTMSDRGKLVGHRNTVQEWISAAISTNRINLPESVHYSLVHALTAAPNAEWLGIRNPVTPEAMILSFADRLSAEQDMTLALASKSGGWGNKHPHRKGKPFTLPAETTI